MANTNNLRLKKIQTPYGVIDLEAIVNTLIATKLNNDYGITPDNTVTTDNAQSSLEKLELEVKDISDGVTTTTKLCLTWDSTILASIDVSELTQGLGYVPYATYLVPSGSYAQSSYQKVHADENGNLYAHTVTLS